MTLPKPVSRPHRVFLSHSSLDRKIAERVLKQLESEGIDCWVSHRDIEPGSEWAETIYDAIASSKAMILLFTGNANESWQVRNELDIATNLKVPIIPVRFDDTPISKGVRYFTSSHQWMEPRSNGRHTKRNDLVTTVRSILEPQEATGSGDMPPRTGPAAGRRKALLPLLALIPVALLVILLANGRGGASAPAENIFVLMAGGSDSWNYASDIASMGDGGFVAAGTWDWGFWSEIWAARFDSFPSLLWSWSDSLAGECSPRILITEDKGLIVAFGEYSDFDQEGYWVRALRLDSTGTVLWDSRKRIEWPGAIQPVFGNMEWNADGSVSMAFTLRILNNMAPFHSHIVELDPAAGGMQWRTIPDRRECVAFLPLPGGGAFHVYLDVLSQSNGIEHFSPDGAVLNNLVIGDLRSQATCAALTSDGGILLAVTGDSYGSGNGDLWLMRFSEGLELLWQQTFGGDLLDSASDILPIPGGGFLVVGGSRSFGDGSSDGWIIRVTESGELVWQSFLDLGGHERLVSADMDSDGSFMKTIFRMTFSFMVSNDYYNDLLNANGFSIKLCN
ncbi:MAG: toll/interleukin-1 receptor domain-containing protein, partial [Candidatus Fermentibacteraceae bacterium]